MSATRPIRPSDLVALVSFGGEVYGNEARPWERLGQQPSGPRPLESAIEQWLSFATGRQTWIHVHGQTIRGLASARRRASGATWEVDCLITPDADVCLGVLDRLCESGAATGVERVFLRLDADSPLLAAAQQAGFIAYATECLWRGSLPQKLTPTVELYLRRRVAADNFPLFRLYNLAVPPSVRQAEALTLREWLAVRELWRGGRAQEMVMEQEGAIVGWASIARADQVMRLALLIHPEKYDCLDAFLAAVSPKVGPGRSVISLVPEYVAPLATALASYGFQNRGRYASLVRRLARPITVTEPIPRGARTSYTLPSLLSKP